MIIHEKQLKKNVESEQILRQLSSVDDLAGGTSVPCTLIAVSLGLCPTMKCTSRC